MAKIKAYFPPPKMWVGVALIGAAGSLIALKAFPAATGWITSKIPTVK